MDEDDCSYDDLLIKTYVGQTSFLFYSMDMGAPFGERGKAEVQYCLW